MKDYKDFPPIKYFIRVLKSCPQSAFLYTQLWQKKDRHNYLVMDKKDSRKDFLLSPTIFRNLLSHLVILNLVYFIENDGKIQVNIVGLNSDEQ